MKSFRIFENIDKYLKYMEFVESSSSHTIKAYALDLSQVFKSDINSYKSDLNEAEIMDAVRKAFNTWASLSLATRNRKAATLKSFFSWSFQEGVLEKDLSLSVTCPKVPKKIPHFISVDEALAVIHSLENEQLLKDKTLFLLLYGGGLRISEACNLKWSHINISQRTLRILGKGKKERLVTIPSLTISALQDLQKQSQISDYVFGDKPLNQRGAYEIIRKAGVRAQLLKPLHPHALRHSFATHLLSSGANLRILQELLGHESLQTTEKYTHLGIDHLARTMDQLHPLGKNSKTP